MKGTLGSLLPDFLNLDGVQGSKEKRANRIDDTKSKASTRLTQQSAKSTNGVPGYGREQVSTVQASGGGYTIIEAMIFLAVTGVLMISALAVFQGQSRRTQFTQGVREFDARIRTAMNEVGSGYFPSNSDFTCSVTGETVSIGIGATEQGSNTDCVFLGKIVQFSENGYSVYTMVGPRQTGGTELQNLEDADPAVIAVASGSGPDVTEEFSLPAGLEITRVNVEAENYDGDLGAIGFVLTLPKYQGGDPISGGQNVDVINLNGSDLDSTKADIISQVAALTEENRTTEKTTICFSDGGSRRAALVVGGSGRQLTTDILIDSNIPGICS